MSRTDRAVLAHRLDALVGPPPRLDAPAAGAAPGGGPFDPGPDDGPTDDRASGRRFATHRWRVAVSWRAAAAAGLALALLAGALVLRAVALRPADPVALPTPSAAASAPGGLVVVHVVGAVAAPGVVTLDSGSRVVDAVDAAGGATADADLSGLNLARPLVDGEQVVVPTPGQEPVAAAVDDDGTTNLNTADEAALDALPGIGPVLAGRIVERRDERPFASVDELTEVTGIGPALLERLRPLVRV